MDHLSEIIESNPLDKKMIQRMMEAVSIDISENRSVTLYHVYQNHLWFSPHPEDSIEARWGLKKCEMIYAQTRTTKDSMAFIERAYRKRDLNMLTSRFGSSSSPAKAQREWTRSECTEPSQTPRKKPGFPLLQRPR